MVGIAGDGASNVDVVAAQQFSRCFETCTRVVIAGSDDHLQTLVGLDGVNEKIEKKTLCFGTRIVGVEDVTAHNERIGLFVGDGLLQPMEEMPMFGRARVLMENVSEVEVGGVDDFHRG